MKKRICLVYAISPIHAVSAVSAILTRHVSSKVSVVILVHWPGAEAELVRELADIIKTMFREFSFVERIIPVSSITISGIVAEKSIPKAVARLREVAGVDHADEIYYPHNVVGTLYQTLSTLFRKAHRICFGDAMGEVFERDVHLSYLGISADASPPVSTGFRARLMSILDIGRLIRRGQDKGTNGSIVLKDPPPHEAVLILPVDQSGAFLKEIPLTVCPRKLVVDVIDRCAESCTELRTYIESLLDRHKGRRRFLLLTENLSEGNFADFEREVEMYCRMVLEHCEPGDVVYLKSHPGETLPRGERIAELLAGKYEVVELDKRFRRYPVELWRSLVLESTSISMSYPVLSLKYLYDMNVIQPMSNGFIEYWFPEWTWASYKNSLSLYMEPLGRLDAWDGKSVLWAGSVPQRQ